MLGFGSGAKQQSGGGRLEREDLWDPQEKGDKQDCFRCFAAELVMRLEDWI